MRCGASVLLAAMLVLGAGVAFGQADEWADEELSETERQELLDFSVEYMSERFAAGEAFGLAAFLPLSGLSVSHSMGTGVLCLGTFNPPADSDRDEVREALIRMVSYLQTELPVPYLYDGETVVVRGTMADGTQASVSVGSSAMKRFYEENQNLIYEYPEAFDEAIPLMMTVAMSGLDDMTAAMMEAMGSAFADLVEEDSEEAEELRNLGDMVDLPPGPDDDEVDEAMRRLGTNEYYLARVELSEWFLGQLAFTVGGSRQRYATSFSSVDDPTVEQVTDREKVERALRLLTTGQ
jgi:hypothetical protein